MKKIILALLLVLALVTTSEGQRRIGGVQRGGPSGAGDPLRTPTGGGSGSPPAAGTEGTAGYTGAQLGSADEVNTNQSEGLVVTFANSGTVSKITAILNAPEGATNAKGCIWSSNGSSLLGCSNGVSIANTGAATYNFTLSPGVSVTATSYLIGIVSEGYTIHIYYGSNTGDILWEDNSNSYSSPQTVTREDNSDTRMNIYATYTY